MLCNAFTIGGCVYLAKQKSLNLKLKDKQLETLHKEIHQHEETERLLQQAKQAADDANSAKTRYLSGVSHELRTPLNTIYGYSQLIERNNNLPEDIRNAAYKIGKSGEHLTSIIEGLLEISKIEAKKVDFLNKETLHFPQFIQSLVESFSMQAESKGIGFSYEPCGYLPMYVSTDPNRLRQILSNLLSNAIKYTFEGHVTLSVSYKNEVAKFNIVDTGVGIAHEKIEHIFDPFWRAQNNNVPGTGLGLSISRLLTELLGGEITVVSKKNEGSTFTLSVMLPKATHDNDAQLPENRPIEGYIGKRRTVLVVDDDENHRQLISQLLSPLGFNVYEASNGEKALALLMFTTIDLFLLDVSMPNMTGWTLAERIRDMKYNVPIIMVSGNAIETQQQKMSTTAHNDYILKPMNVNELLDKITAQLSITWTYAQSKQRTNTQTTTQSLLSPPPNILTEMKQAADIGHVKGIAATLEGLQEKYPAFYKQANNLLSEYNIEGIQQLINQCK